MRERAAIDPKPEKGFGGDDGARSKVFLWRVWGFRGENGGLMFLNGCVQLNNLTTVEEEM